MIKFELEYSFRTMIFNSSENKDSENISQAMNVPNIYIQFLVECHSLEFFFRIDISGMVIIDTCVIIITFDLLHC